MLDDPDLERVWLDLQEDDETKEKIPESRDSSLIWRFERNGDLHRRLSQHRPRFMNFS